MSNTVIQAQDEIEVFINGNGGISISSDNTGYVALSSLAACHALCEAIQTAAKLTKFKPVEEGDEE